jgi:mannose-6-phosphate isomerase-like protein (cupin superfamily)
MDIKEYILSGILEQYVLGALHEEEAIQVEEVASKYPEVQKEIDDIRSALEQYAIENAVQPSRKLKPFLMATIDFMERMERGEEPSFPPLLNQDSQPTDFASWLNREDMILPGDSEDIFAKIINYTPELQTAIIWIKDSAPLEEHHDLYEKFLILEGTCDVIVDDIPHSLVPGDYFAVPLNKSHSITVTSSIPCKVLLQRIAA